MLEFLRVARKGQRTYFLIGPGKNKQLKNYIIFVGNWKYIFEKIFFCNKFTGLGVIKYGQKLCTVDG